MLPSTGAPTWSGHPVTHLGPSDILTGATVISISNKSLGDGVICQLISDLHLEFPRCDSLFDENEPEHAFLMPPADTELSDLRERGVLLLAGDIASPLRSEQTAGRFEKLLVWAKNRYAAVAYVAGNHDTCHGEYNEAVAELQRICDKFENVHFLHRSVAVFNHLRILGCTLWTHIPKVARRECRGLIEYRRTALEGEFLQVEDTNRFHEMDVEFLRESLERIREEKVSNPSLRVVILSHHAPLNKGTGRASHEVPTNLVNLGFANDMGNFIAEYSDVIDCWAFGHTHFSTCQIVRPESDTELAQQREVLVVSNQVGYFGDPSKTRYSGKGFYTGYRKGLAFVV